MSRNPSERRRYPRYDLEYTIQLISSDGETVVTALTSNISDGGVRLPIPSQCAPAPGKSVLVNLTIQRGGGEVETYHGTATVVRRTGADQDGLAEVALMFSVPMNLRLQSEMPIVSISL